MVGDGGQRWAGQLATAGAAGPLQGSAVPANRVGGSPFRRPAETRRLDKNSKELDSIVVAKSDLKQLVMSAWNIYTPSCRRGNRMRSVGCFHFYFG